MEHARYQATHANESELRWVEVAKIQRVDSQGKKQSRKSTDKQGGRKSASHASGAERQRRGESLQKDDAGEENQDNPDVVFELGTKRVAVNRTVITCQRGIYGIISFAVQGRKEVDEQT